MTNKSKIVKAVVERKDFQTLLDTLKAEGYTLLGPTVKNNTVIYDKIASTEDLPIGWIDHQENGSYRLTADDKKTLFGYVVGPHSWKKFLYPPIKKLWGAKRDGSSFKVDQNKEKPVKQAFIGVRSCELQAIAIQDKILVDGPEADVAYAQLRSNTFIVAVNCVRTGGTCFCAPMGTGPKAKSDFDLALTEIISSDRHYFLVEVGSEAGAKVLQSVRHQAANDGEIETAESAIARTAEHMDRQIETNGLKEILYRNFDHPNWAAIAKRCLSCGNCTMVCPTCFCTSVEDTTDLSGQTAERWRKWDSCFTVDFSYIHGGSIRNSGSSRYRQWMTHKLGYWQDQFGVFGCVGCGRCITWCPVGIDLTEEARVFRGNK